MTPLISKSIHSFLYAFKVIRSQNPKISMSYSLCCVTLNYSTCIIVCYRGFLDIIEGFKYCHVSGEDESNF